MKIVHIGLGKTGTTSLQKYIFSELKAKGLVDTYNDPKWYYQILKCRYHPYPIAAQALSPFFQADTQCHMISNESLLTWNPACWQQDCDYLHAVFGSHTTILITLRSPRSYLRSVYQQRFQEGAIIKPQHFFLNSDRYAASTHYARASMGEIFDCDALNYQALAEMLAKRFDRVIIASRKSVISLSFLPTLLNVPKTDLQWCKNIINNAPPANPSYSAVAMKLTSAREWCFRRLGMKSMGSFDRPLYAPETLSDIDYVWFKNLSLRQKLQVLPKRLFTWRRLMQSIVSRYLPSPPYRLPEDTYWGKYIAENESFYETLEKETQGFRLYENSVPQNRNAA